MIKPKARTRKGKKQNPVEAANFEGVWSVGETDKTYVSLSEYAQVIASICPKVPKV